MRILNTFFEKFAETWTAKRVFEQKSSFSGSLKYPDGKGRV